MSALIKHDGFAKSPNSVLHCILHHSTYIRTPRSSGLVRLANFYKIWWSFFLCHLTLTFHKDINVEQQMVIKETDGEAKL
ncbi:MAG: hypothetical protein HF978_07080 [Desulfobacteraceae bacterium]|nr:hypothetical protein [Desulfobacteraceae bacterium]MBC2755295.1 hypothetical protein [Desulfobacteraceae bacterium]